jgi:hypothetical protein
VAGLWPSGSASPATGTVTARATVTTNPRTPAWSGWLDGLDLRHGLDLLNSLDLLNRLDPLQKLASLKASG